MEPLIESIDLDIDESNELAFKIRMEGAAASPAKVRLVCEGNDVSYMFNGYGTAEPEVVQFTLPQMSGKINEGMYQARVEVLVDNRYFSPLRFDINFKKTMKVVAESVRVITKPKTQEIKVTASPAFVTKQTPASSVVKFEQRQEPLKVTETKSLRQEEAADAKGSSLRDVYTVRKLLEMKNKPRKK